MNIKDTLYKYVRIKSIISETDDAKSFILEPLHGWNPFYKAGQFITLVFKKRDKEDRRSYSFSSAPSLKEEMTVTIKRIPNGEYSRQLFDRSKEGDILTTSGIAGYFCLPDNDFSVEHLFFLAAGSGITPIYSLIKTALYTTDKKITLIYSNVSPEKTIFYKGLLNLQQKFSNRLHVDFLFSQNMPITQGRLSKVLLYELLKKHNISLQNTLFYLCGPTGYMLMATISLITAGVPEKNIRKENFNTQKRKISPVPPDTGRHNITVLLNNKVYKFSAQYPETILSAAKKHHISLPYSCEAGNCGSCTATCTNGEVWMAYNEVLLENEIATGKVLTCQGYPVKGDVTLQFD